MSLDIKTVNLHVPDGYEDHPQRQLWTEESSQWERYLEENLDELITDEHPARQWFYSSEGMRQWGTFMPSAAALYPLQRPEEDYSFYGLHFEEHARNFARHILDARGIRTRAKVMSDVVSEAFAGKEKMKWTSLACGAAVPLYEALKALPEARTDITLVDIDDRALGFAHKIFTDDKEIESRIDLSILNRNLVRTLSASDELVQEIGAESQDMVDMLGIFEYFKAPFASMLLHNAMKLVAEDGMLILANMLDTHPQLNINQRVIEWPKIYPRSAEEVQSIIVNAGIDPEKVTFYLPQDGVYLVAAIRK